MKCTERLVERFATWFFLACFIVVVAVGLWRMYSAKPVPPPPDISKEAPAKL